MTALLLAVAVLTALAVGAAAGHRVPRRLRARRPPVTADRSVSAAAGRILLPFTGTSISRRSLEAALRLAVAEDAVIMPAFLASVPRHLPIDAPLPAQCLQAMPLLEAIEQQARAAGVAVDARVGRGRSYRDALRHVLADEPVDRIVVSASANPRIGPSPHDLEWLLAKAPGEVLILRPGRSDERRVSAAGIAGHF